MRVTRANLLQTLRAVIGKTWIETETPRQLADFLRLLDQLRLEARIGDVQQRFDDLGVSLATQIGNAVLGLHDIPQMPGDGAMPILPDDVRIDLTARFAPAAQDQDRPRALQRMPLGHKVVLPADTAEHPAVFQLVGTAGAE